MVQSLSQVFNNIVCVVKVFLHAAWSAFSVCITSQFHSFIMLFQAFICLCDNLTVVLLISSEHPGFRQSPSEFVIPVAKYCKAINTQVDVGMRFRMVFETEESSVRR
jgi:hypothetical protein